MRAFILRTRAPVVAICTSLCIFASSSAFHPTNIVAPNVASREWKGSQIGSLFASKKSIPENDERTTPPTNSRGQEILEFLQRRYTHGNTSPKDRNKEWRKMQMYLYRSHNLLSMEQVETVVEFLDSRVDLATSCKILQENPRVLRKSVESSLAPTADFLLELWGASLFQIAMEQNPKLLLARGVGYSQRTNQDDKQVIDALNAAGLSSTAVQKLKRSAPYVFGISIQKIQSVLTFLIELLDSDSASSRGSTLNKHQKTVAGIISSHPYLLNLSVEKNLQPRVAFLQTACQMNITDVAKMVRASKGTILNLAIEENLQPTLAYLKETLAVENTSQMDALRKCLLLHPQVLTLSLSNLRRKVDYFSGLEEREKRRRGLDQESSNSSSLASRILRRCPTVYSLSLKDNIIPKVEILSRAWGVEFESTVSLSKLLREFPNILTSSLEGNIFPTLNFFNRTGYTRLTDDWEWVEGSARIPGRYLGASLYNRLLPRWHYCLSQGSEDQGVDGESLIPTNPPSLNMLVLANDAKFCESLALDLKNYVDFKENAIPRLKFSSQFDTWVKTGRPIQV